jgi:hypothetical protein
MYEDLEDKIEEVAKNSRKEGAEEVVELIRIGYSAEQALAIVREKNNADV